MRRLSFRPGDALHTPARKRRYNERLFTEVAPRYACATRAMSLGRDAAWKRALVGLLPDRPAPVCVDLACGTGDVSLLLAERYPGGRVVGMDLTEPMLRIARQRAHPRVSFVRGDMNDLPFRTAAVDVVTGGYALRNAPDLGRALDEVRRILRPGGAAAFLDFSKPAGSVLKRIELAVLWSWGAMWGAILHRDPAVYGYIATSLRLFPDRPELRAMVRDVGFEVIVARPRFLGILELQLLRRISRA